MSNVISINKKSEDAQTPDPIHVRATKAQKDAINEFINKANALRAKKNLKPITFTDFVLGTVLVSADALEFYNGPRFWEGV